MNWLTAGVVGIKQAVMEELAEAAPASMVEIAPAVVKELVVVAAAASLVGRVVEEYCCCGGEN